jgi:hypothetical protein
VRPVNRSGVPSAHEALSWHGQDRAETARARVDHPQHRPHAGMPMPPDDSTAATGWFHAYRQASTELAALIDGNIVTSVLSSPAGNLVVSFCRRPLALCPWWFLGGAYRRRGRRLPLTTPGQELILSVVARISADSRSSPPGPAPTASTSSPTRQARRQSEPICVARVTDSRTGGVRRSGWEPPTQNRARARLTGSRREPLLHRMTRASATTRPPLGCHAWSLRKGAES